VEPEASGRENMRLLARLRGRTRAEADAIVEEIAEFTGLGDFFEMPVKTYSPGMLARLAFAVGTSWRPDILIMDEWIAVADERFKAQAMQRLGDYVASARTVVLATHDPVIVRDLCTKVLVLEQGRIASFGPVEQAPYPLAA
jgi:lipopolysaccharide transport system ATP-binding protein